MSNWLSNKFRWMSCVATWAVVCAHSRTVRWCASLDDLVNRMQFLCGDLFLFAVPLFFLISGFFFVQSYQKYGWVGLVKKKFMSLYLPAVIWMVIALIVLLPIRVYSGNNIPNLASFLAVPFLLIEKTGSNHFWYVRGLLFFFVVSPFVFFAVKRRWLAIFLMVFVMMIPGPSWAAVKHVPCSVFYFVGGALIASIRRHDIPALSQGSWTVAAAVGLVMAFLAKSIGILPMYYFNVLFQPVLAIVFLWCLYDWIDSKFTIPKFPEWLNVMFFVYCIHQITLCWAGGILRISIGTGPCARLCGYFLLWLTFLVDVVLANILRREFPRVFKLLSGGR